MKHSNVPVSSSSETCNIVSYIYTESFIQKMVSKNSQLPTYTVLDFTYDICHDYVGTAHRVLRQSCWPVVSACHGTADYGSVVQYSNSTVSTCNVNRWLYKIFKFIETERSFTGIYFTVFTVYRCMFVCTLSNTPTCVCV